MKYYSFFLMIFFIASSCKSNKYEDNEVLCEVLVNIYDDDQKYRGKESELVDPFFKILDSIMISEGITKKEYIKFEKSKQLIYGKIARGVADKRNEVSKKVKDSLWALQSSLDEKNTKILIEIIEERGFPDIKKLECKGYASPFLIFVHSPEEYWSEIKNILDQEIKSDRITKGDYDYIMWHINGRKEGPLSPMPIEDIQIIED